MIFSPDAAIGVFRVAQEALTNILKHAEAKSVDLRVEILNDTFVLRIADDGRGIETKRQKTSTSHGLASMRHRVGGIGGTLQIFSPGTGGTIVTAIIPLSRMLRPEPSEAAVALAAGAGQP
jgi:signal transduction histidine kinase